MLSSIGPIDFVGQVLADRVVTWTISAATILGLAIGFAQGSTALVFQVFGAGVVLASIAAIPPWGIYNRHPVKFQPESQSDPASTSK
ncbi:microsomal signal peptidase 12kDa subunit [Blastocladiella britannica]|nr:microsomal signal peptidase 12kDa subunit [Blastocladiella britannica]